MSVFDVTRSKSVISQNVIMSSATFLGKIEGFENKNFGFSLFCKSEFFNLETTNFSMNRVVR